MFMLSDWQNMVSDNSKILEQAFLNAALNICMVYYERNNNIEQKKP